MASSSRTGTWFSEEQAMLVLALASLVLAGLVVRPYLQFIIFGVILAYLLWPLQDRLADRIRPDLAAGVLTLATVVAVMVPLSYLFLRASRQALDVIGSIEAGDLDVSIVEQRLADLGLEVDVTALYEDNSETIAGALELLAWSVFDVVRSLPHVFIGLTITVFVLFVLLRDGDRLLAWINAVVPISQSVQDELNHELDRLMRASVVGNVAASFIEAVLLGIGIWIVGFGNVVFLTVLAFVFALLPIVGVFFVWVPLAGYLLALNRPVEASFLIVYGMLVSISDFYTRPLVIGHSAALNSAIIVIGVFGGLVAFGAVGLLIGPVVLGGAKVFIEVLMRERTRDLDERAARP